MSAPASASATAMSRPIPRLAPAITTTLSFSAISHLFLHRSCTRQPPRPVYLTPATSTEHRRPLLQERLHRLGVLGRAAGHLVAHLLALPHRLQVLLQRVLPQQLFDHHE